MGWCLRDHFGRFAMAGTTWLEGNCSIVEDESIALLEALKNMENRGIFHVIFETDSKSVVNAIHHFRGGSSEFSYLIFEIIKQQTNMVVHSLARVTIS
jgi:ribonuclease HI